MDKITKRIFSRLFFVGVAILVQVFWIILSVATLGSRLPFMTLLVEIVSLLAVLWLVNKDINPAYKLAWTILILAVPIAGAVIYFMFGKSRLAKDLNEKLEEARRETEELLREDREVTGKLAELDEEAALQSRYICDYAGFPLYQKTETQYFRVGEELYLAMIEELNRAEHFIFLEYFIIDDGIMWQGILDILSGWEWMSASYTMTWGAWTRFPPTSICSFAGEVLSARFLIPSCLSPLWCLITEITEKSWSLTGIRPLPGELTLRTSILTGKKDSDTGRTRAFCSGERRCGALP